MLYRLSHPTHSIFNDPLFSTPEYASFTKEMQARLNTTSPEEDPHMVAIQKALPHVSNQLRTLECAMQTGQEAQVQFNE